MKIKSWASGVWLVALTMFMAAPSHAESPRVLKMLLLKDAPPLSYRNEKGDFVGFNVDLGRLLCEALKAQCEFQEALHTDIISLVANGNVDVGMVSLIITPERAKRVAFTEPYRYSKTFWISHLPMTQSKNARVGVVDGSVQHKWAMDNGRQHGWRIVTLAVNPELSNALRDGRVDAVISPSSTALEIMKERDLSQAGFSARVIEAEEFNNPVAIAVNPSDKDLCEKLNAALRIIKNNGQLDKINSKYYPFRIF